MEVLLIEDDIEKRADIEECLRAFSDHNECDIEVVSALDEARRKIIEKSYDLIVFDFYLPFSRGAGDVQDVAWDLISEFKHSKNYQTEAIAITKYELADVQNMPIFNSAGVSVVRYCSDEDDWKSSLQQKINKIKNTTRYDFLIFCALTKERSGYLHANAVMGEQRKIKGMSCQDISIADKRGLCLVPTNAGLVNMAILAAKAIEEFQPKIVAMSGICAGVPGESELMDLIVGKLCWEYQTGKFKGSGFQFEPYQRSIPHELEVDLTQFVEDSSVKDRLKNNIFVPEANNFNIYLAPVSSGSAVISDNKRMQAIGEQHRKMAALEMEMYSLYEAACQSLAAPLFFGVKTVVDMGDADKNDALHQPACIMSARFVCDFLSRKLA